MDLVVPSEVIGLGVQSEEECENNELYFTKEYCLEKGNFVLASGTSTASPVLAGIIALMIEANPNLNRDQIFEILAKTARKIRDGDYLYLDWDLEGDIPIEYKTCEAGDDTIEWEDSNYSSYYEIIYGGYYSYAYDEYFDKYYKSHPNPYDTWLCQKYSWNKYYGYGMVDAYKAIKEAFFSREELPEDMSKYNLPKSWIEQIPKKTLLEKTIENASEGWNLLGNGKDVKASKLIKSGAKLIWTYDAKDKKWYFYSENKEITQKIENAGYEKIDTVESGKGVWVLK